ncbi:nuclear transport factor 2 family protein [Microbispora sp. ATCC PTA-5024]|uniref:nuclear transport factor 2 family protein n=1 Tax=Microbispora sp. ATCC PTA-5024 TaxID=316330 RepID=UPI0003DCA442|nr:nuclear transport factor 2 family protein [Microbispora sp. ATCC PTA-5024]ETK34784.1 hypothetical protein MPTA5024_17915 [Microbispora sp. ATCC PTA-5024]
MSENPSVTIARDFYNALAKGDLDSIRSDQLADDVVFHVPGRGSLAAEYRGKDQVLGYLGRLGELTENTIRFEPDSFLLGEDTVAAVIRVRGERAGRSLDDRGVQVFKIAGGKIAERWSYPYDPYVIDEFFA